MEYFRLTWDIEPQIVGVRDGLGPCVLDKEFYQRHRWYEDIFINNQYDESINLPAWWKPLAVMPDYARPLELVTMDKRAKLTDFIDFGGFLRGFIVNDRLRGLLEQSAHLPRHCYLPVSFLQGEREITGYWWLCYDLETGEHNVDFSRSEFKANPFDKEDVLGSKLGLNTYADYLA